jgi:regulator of cell morphogenesis and NO signaling
MIINDVIQKYSKTIGIFKDFGVDSCCGGGFSIEKTAAMSGGDMEKLLEKLNKAIDE